MFAKIRAFLFLPALGCVCLSPCHALAKGAPGPDNRVYASAMMSSALKGNQSSGGNAGFFLGVGKPLTDRFGLELNFQRYQVRMDASHGGYGVDQKTYGLDGLFYLHRGTRWTPYLEFGGGRVDSAYGSTGSNGNFISVGAGFFWRVDDHLSIRGDLRINRLPSGVGIGGNASAMEYPVANFGIATQFGERSAAVSAPTSSSPLPPPPAPRDSDHDGVPDTMDQCPGTPAGVRVDTRGCPIDSDGDGVPDYLDKCPNTPLGVKVNPRGCPVTPRLKLPTLHFAFDSSRLSAADRQALKKVVEELDKASDVQVLLVGYADSTGPAAYNLKLSRARAGRVRHYLVAHGLAADRLRTRGEGESHPVASNKTAAGRAQNRRVELHVIKNGTAGKPSRRRD